MCGDCRLGKNVRFIREELRLGKSVRFIPRETYIGDIRLGELNLY